MWNLSSSQLKVATHTHTYNEVGISAGTWLTNNEWVFAVDTTTIATKADIADLGSFTVVDTLPSVATADTKTIYLLWPIWTGADKYEEWIVTEDSQQQKQWTKIWETSVDLSWYATTTALTNWLATKQDTLTASDGIDIDWSNNISVDVTDIIGTWLSEDANNNIIVDTTVVATQTDLSWKQDKATSGSTAPATTPSYVWQQYIDTTADKMYVATGTSSSSDWTEVGAWSWDMLYADFNWTTKTWATITLDLNSEIEPSANFTVNAPATIKDWQIYVLRVITWATVYTMTLGTNITNPYSEDLTLAANTIAHFSFVWIDNKLELQPSIEVAPYTAWTWITISNNTISADTTVLATKQDIANLSSFEVVDTLPSVSTASTKTIYLLGPIWTWADKYEEWIVTESETSTSWTTTDLQILVNYDTGNNRFQCQIVSLNRYEWQYIILDSFNYDWWTLQSISYNNNTYTEFPVNVWLNDHSPAIFYVTFDTYSTDPNNASASGRASTSAWTVWWKVWTKIWETSIDLSTKQDKATSGSTAPATTPTYVWQQYVDTTNDILYVATGTSSSSDWTEVWAWWWFEVVSTLPSVAQADENKIYVLWPIWTGTDKYEEWIVTEEYWTSWTTHFVGWMMENQVGPTINYVLMNYSQLDWLYLSLNNVWLESWNSISSISFGTDTYTEVPANLGLYTYWTSPARFSIEFSNVPTDASVYSLTIDSSTSAWWNQKVWTKIWETSVNAWDMLYADFNWVTKTWNSITLSLNSTITPSANFTVNAPATIQDWQIYILRVVSWATAYTMTLGTWITNPYSTSTTLTANYTDQFVFQAIGWSLELLPDADVDITGKQDKATSWSTAPATTPSYVWQQYVDTTTITPYIATWTSSSSDWQATPVLSKQTWAATNVKIWVWTQAAYEALSGSYDSNTLYFTTSSS